MPPLFHALAILAVLITRSTGGDLSNTVSDLYTFAKQHRSAMESQDAILYAASFAVDCNYCYAEGYTGNVQDFIEKDRQELIEKWPYRKYMNGWTEFTVVSEDFAKWITGYEYIYQSGSKSTQGYCREICEGMKVNGRWQFTRFDEDVIKSNPSKSSGLSRFIGSWWQPSGIVVRDPYVMRSNWRKTVITDTMISYENSYTYTLRPGEEWPFEGWPESSGSFKEFTVIFRNATKDFWVDEDGLHAVFHNRSQQQWSPASMPESLFTDWGTDADDEFIYESYYDMLIKDGDVYSPSLRTLEVD